MGCFQVDVSHDCEANLRDATAQAEMKAPTLFVMSQMLQVSFLTHRIHVWYVYLNVPYKFTKCGGTMKPEGRIGDQTFQDLEMCENLICASFLQLRKTTNYVARLVVSQDQMLRVSFLFVPHAQAALVHSHKTLRNFLCYDRLFQ